MLNGFWANESPYFLHSKIRNGFSVQSRASLLLSFLAFQLNFLVFKLFYCCLSTRSALLVHAFSVDLVKEEYVPTAIHLVNISAVSTMLKLIVYSFQSFSRWRWVWGFDTFQFEVNLISQRFDPMMWNEFFFVYFIRSKRPYQSLSFAKIKFSRLSFVVFDFLI